MEYLFVAFALLLHTYFWGSGAAMLLLPTPWRRYWPVFAAPVGLTLQSLVVWTGAHVGLEGTSAYGRFALLLPALLLAAAARGRPAASWATDLRRLAWLGLVQAGCLGLLVLPLARGTTLLTTASLGSCDAADYAAGARVLLEFARGDRAGFLGQAEVVQVMSVDNFYDFWLRLNHFTPSALIALAGAVLGLAPFEITGVLTAVLAVTVIPVGFWIARAGLRHGPRESLWVAALYGVNPLTWYAVYHVAMGQLLAAQAIGLLTWIGLEVWRRGARARVGLRWAGLLGAFFVLILGSYNFILLVALVPLVAFAGGQAVWTGSWRRFGRWLLCLLAPLALAVLVQSERVAGLAERFALFRTYDFGWAIPGLSPEGWLGIVAAPSLAPHGGVLRLLLAAAVVAALVIALRPVRPTRPGRGFLALSFTVPVLVGYGYLLLRGARLGTLASYDAYKLLAVFHPGLLASLCLWLSPGEGRWRVHLKVVMLGLVSGLSLLPAAQFMRRMEQPPLVVDRNLAQIRELESRPDIRSVNVLNDDMWSRLWANGFLLRKPQYFRSHTYEGRLNTPLRGDWDLTSGVLRLSLPPPGSLQLNPAVALVATRSDRFVRLQFGTGWYDHEQEAAGGQPRRWMPDRAEIEVDNPQTGPVRLRWNVAGIETLAPRDLEFWFGGERLQVTALVPGRTGDLGQEITVPPGRSVVELRTPQPLTVPGRGDSRRLGAMIHAIGVEVLP
jgi:hypothetical protein